ncbi:MAG: RNA polymerase subunit sigma-70, partial [Pedobacter sp.]|nr:RNA polymerase subunit sigma-70 [Pedobacter sp.]
MLAYNQLTDRELSSLFKGGDEASFAEIYNRFYGILYIHACKRLRDEEEARDIIHELFTSLWTRRESFDVTANLAGYLYAAMRNR